MTTETSTGSTSPSATPRNGQKARRTKARLLTAAREVFERDGFVETRVTDIAGGAGLSHGTFYTYFTSKEDVFRELALGMMDRFEQSRGSHTIHDATSAYEALLDINDRYARMMRDNAALMLVWRQAAGVNADLRDLLRAEDDLFVSRAARGIQRFRSLGLVGPGVDDTETARALGLMVKEYCTEVFTGEHQADLDVAVRTITNIWAVAVGIPVPGSAPDSST